MTEPKKIVLLGATGSIGKNTLQVIRKHPDRLQLVGISAHSNAEKLAQIATEFNVPHAYLPEAAGKAENFPSATKLDRSADGLLSLASLDAADLVVIAVVGASGLSPTLASLQAGKNIVLANKESLVLGGDLVMQTAKESQAKVLPADSEHNAIFQCLPHDSSDASQSFIKKLILSASGGPFRTWDAKKIASATPAEACAHPNWCMGNKISVDSASMMNKGLECIEAKWLFDTSMDKIDVLIHPQSIVHSLVQYVDGSVLAQLGNPDMRTPIAHGLAWPERLSSGVADLNLSEIAQLSFEAPDLDKFPCLQLAMNAATAGGDAPIILNAANEIAVDAFLNGKIGFSAIAHTVEKTLESFDFYEPESLAAVQDSDSRARVTAESMIKQIEF